MKVPRVSKTHPDCLQKLFMNLKGLTVIVIDANLRLYNIPLSSLADSKAFVQQQIRFDNEAVDIMVIGQYKNAEATEAVMNFYADSRSCLPPSLSFTSFSFQHFLIGQTEREQDAPSIHDTDDDISTEPTEGPSSFNVLNVDLEQLVSFGKAPKLPKENPHG
uniref:STAS domain-containing protein n=1 Tax=Panagrellus redivivus TaxID=6233 RepID=A0A7E4W006_PANRE